MPSPTDIASMSETEANKWKAAFRHIIREAADNSRLRFSASAYDIAGAAALRAFVESEIANERG